MKLTNTAIKQAKARQKAYKLFDGGRLYLQVNSSGSKYWRMKYRFADREKLLAFGVYLDVTLKAVRDCCDVARRLLSDGIDLAVSLCIEKEAAKELAGNSFELVARDWFATQSPKWAESHSGKIIRRLEMYVFPKLGRQPIAEIKPREVLEVIRGIEKTGYIETAYRAL